MDKADLLPVSRLRVMDVLWKRGEVGAKTVLEEISEPMELAACQMRLLRMRRNGAVKARRDPEDSRRILYRPAYTRAEEASKWVKAMQEGHIWLEAVRLAEGSEGLKRLLT